MLPDVTGKITRGFQLHDPTTVEHIMGNVVLGDVIETLSILSLPLSGEEVTVAWSADRAGDERVFEPNPFACQSVNIGRLGHRVPAHAE